MSRVTRFGISMDSSLLARFDDYIAQRGYSNRSEAVRDLVRDSLVQAQWAEASGDTVGTITLIYDHHQRELQNRLTGHQHSSHALVISSMHVHLDAHHCLEVLAVQGQAADIRRLADELLSLRGVKHGKLVMTSSGKDI